VGPPAQVDELTLAIEGDGTILQPFHQLHLVDLALLLEVLEGFSLAHFKTFNGVVLFDDLVHFRLDGRQVLRRQGAFQVKIVVKPVFNRRPNG